MIGDKNSILTVASSLIEHAAVQQSVTAQNIAHADTPGYRAQSVSAFEEAYRSGLTQVRDDPSAPVQSNGNSVSLEQQVLHLASARGQHELGLGLMDQTMNMFRAAISGSR